MKRVYWDTMIYAYWLEDKGMFGRRVEQIRSTMQRRGDVLYSSLYVLSELLVGPLKQNDHASVESIQEFFDSSEVTMLPYTRQAVSLFAELRAHHGIKPLDALHLTIAANSGADLFLTYDMRLRKVNKPGLPFIASLDTDLF